MKLIATMVALAVPALATATPTAPKVHKHSAKQLCRSRHCKRKEFLKHHPVVRLRHYSGQDTTCYAQGGAVAGHGVAHFGIVANNFLPFGTKIRLDRPAFGRRDFVVEDHIGSGSSLDIFYPSESACNAFGRQSRGYSVMGRR